MSPWLGLPTVSDQEELGAQSNLSTSNTQGQENIAVLWDESTAVLWDESTAVLWDDRKNGLAYSH